LGFFIQRDARSSPVPGFDPADVALRGFGRLISERSIVARKGRSLDLRRRH
jgi:hypothetical protein